MSDLQTCTKRATGRVSGTLEESRSGGANARRFPAYLAFRPSCWRWRRASRPSARSRPAPSARRRFPNRDSKPWAPNQARPRAWVSRVWAAAGRTGPRRPPPPWRGAGGLGVVLGVAGCATSARRTRAQSPSQKSDTQADFRILARDGDGILCEAPFLFSVASASRAPKNVTTRSLEAKKKPKTIKISRETKKSVPISRQHRRGDRSIRKKTSRASRSSGIREIATPRIFSIRAGGTETETETNEAFDFN